MSTVEKMPPAIAADGVTVLFRSQLQTAKGKVVLPQPSDAPCRVVVRMRFISALLFLESPTEVSCPP